MLVSGSPSGDQECQSLLPRMSVDLSALIIPSFIAGILTFLAPCTLPLVPGYLSFIAGVSPKELKNPETVAAAKRKIFLNGIFFVLGFTAVFVLLGSVFSIGGVALGRWRGVITRIGGLFIVLFGLFMLGALKLPFLNALQAEHRVKFPQWLKPGNPSSAFIFGSTFALGWSPCVGPILGAVLTLAATSGTIGQGAFLLTIFSLGMGIPFLIIAATIGSASRYLNKLGKYVHAIEIVGGILLIILGLLMFFDQFQVFIGWMYNALEFLNYDGLYKYL